MEDINLQELKKIENETNRERKMSLIYALDLLMKSCRFCS